MWWTPIQQERVWIPFLTLLFNLDFRDNQEEQHKQFKPLNFPATIVSPVKSKEGGKVSKESLPLPVEKKTSWTLATSMLEVRITSPPFPREHPATGRHQHRNPSTGGPNVLQSIQERCPHVFYLCKYFLKTIYILWRWREGPSRGWGRLGASRGPSPQRLAS